MMHRATDASTPAHGSSPAPSPSSNAGASSSPQPLDGLNNDGHVCPFCGLTRDITEDFDPSAPCPRCTLADTPTTRNATKARIGPWHVRQMRNPWAPGMRWETLLALIKRGQVTKDSVVRGPTTHQLWKRASEIKGLSREFAVCYSCGGDIDTQANLCAHCNRLQEPPANPNVLVETREVGNQPPVADAATTPSPPTPQPQAPSKAAAPSPVASRPNGKAPAHHDDADDAPAHLDIGSATPPVTDPHEMLTVDNPESAAAVARSAAARGKGRPARPAGPTATPPPTPAASTLPSPSRPLQLRKRQPGSEDALLTPQELAAAFQLDFTPSDGSPGAAGESDRRSPRGKTSRKRVAFVFLLLLAGGAAVLMYVRPDLREKATAWSDKTYASVKQFITARTAPAAKPTITPDAQPATRPSNAVLAQSPKPPTPAPALTPTTIPARREPIVIAPTPPKVGGPKTVVVGDPPIAPPAPAPTPAHARESTKVLDPVGDALNNPPSDASITASSKTTNAAAVAVPPPVEIIKVAPAPTSAPAVAKPPPPAKVWTNIAEAEDEARRLWRLAIDAEQNQDFVEAVACYEQIKKLPRDVHPSGLEMRLSLAKKLMK